MSVAGTTFTFPPSAASSFLKTRIGKRVQLWFGTSNNVYSDEEKTTAVGKFQLSEASLSASYPTSRTLTIEINDDGTLVLAITSPKGTDEEALTHSADLIGGSGTYKNKRGHGTLTIDGESAPLTLNILTFVR